MPAKPAVLELTVTSPANGQNVKDRRKQTQQHLPELCMLWFNRKAGPCYQSTLINDSLMHDFHFNKIHEEEMVSNESISKPTSLNAFRHLSLLN